MCGRRFKHLGSHLWHGHQVLAREYKEEFGLPYNTALISNEIKAKKQVAFEEYREKYVKNLIRAGKKYQFRKGHTGLRRISEQERVTIVKRIKEVNKRKKVLQPCPVCKIQFNHLESHLYNKHKLIKV